MFAYHHISIFGKLMAQIRILQFQNALYKFIWRICNEAILTINNRNYAPTKVLTKGTPLLEASKIFILIPLPIVIGTIIVLSLMAA